MPHTCPVGADHRRSNKPPGRTVAAEVRHEFAAGRSREWLSSHFSLTPYAINVALKSKPRRKPRTTTPPPSSPVEVTAVES